jgi:preprotein translocase subunit Sec61beta
VKTIASKTGAKSVSKGQFTNTSRFRAAGIYRFFDDPDSSGIRPEFAPLTTLEIEVCISLVVK